MKVLCFSLNTYQDVLCEKYYFDQNNKYVTEYLVTKSFFRFTKKNDCYNPIFFSQINSKIKLESPDIICFTTVNDKDNGTYFHSDFLPNKMSEYHYKIIDQDKFVSTKTIRMSLFIENDDHYTQALLLEDNKDNCRGTYSLALYLSTRVGLICFIGTHFYLANNNCYNRIKTKFLDGLGINYTFIMGDFGGERNNKLKQFKSYQYCDDDIYNKFDLNRDNIVYDSDSLHTIRCIDYATLPITVGQGYLKNHHAAVSVFELSGLTPCNRLGQLLNDSNSCYIDSLLMILLFEDNTFTNDYILNATTTNKLEKSIQNDLLLIKQMIINGSSFGCTLLRQHLQEYVNKYLPKFNWINEQQEPRDLFIILTRVFNIPDLAKVEDNHFVSNENCQPLIQISHDIKNINVGINIGVGDLTDIVIEDDEVTFKEKEQILLTSFINSTICTEFDPYNYYEYNGQFYKYFINQTTYIDMPLLWVHVDRLNENGKVRTPVIPVSNINNLKLRGIIIHQGSGKGGHYMSYILCQDVWYFYNDMYSQLVRIGNFDEVLKYNPDNSLFGKVMVFTDATDYIYY